MAGIVDRLAVTEDAILIADYKTNRDPPRNARRSSEAYVAQLALYRAVLAQLYPGKAVRAALVWTEVPDLMEVSAEAMDAALAAAHRPDEALTDSRVVHTFAVRKRAIARAST